MQRSSDDKAIVLPSDYLFIMCPAFIHVAPLDCMSVLSPHIHSVCIWLQLIINRLGYALCYCQFVCLSCMHRRQNKMRGSPRCKKCALPLWYLVNLSLLLQNNRKKTHDQIYRYKFLINFACDKIFVDLVCASQARSN